MRRFKSVFMADRLGDLPTVLLAAISWALVHWLFCMHERRAAIDRHFVCNPCGIDWILFRIFGLLMALAWSSLITLKSARLAIRIKLFWGIFSKPTKCRPGWYQPTTEVESSSDPVGLRPHPSSRIHLTDRYNRKQNRSKKILAERLEELH